MYIYTLASLGYTASISSYIERENSLVNDMQYKERDHSFVQEKHKEKERDLLSTYFQIRFLYELYLFQSQLKDLRKI